MALTDLVLIFVIIAVISGFFHWMSAMAITDGGSGKSKMPLFFNPIDLYKHTKLNWVGVILVYLLCFVLCPIFVIGGLLKRN